MSTDAVAMIVLPMLWSPVWMPLLLSWWLPQKASLYLAIACGLLMLPAVLFFCANISDHSRYQWEGAFLLGGTMFLFVASILTWGGVALRVWAVRRHRARLAQLARAPGP